MLLQDPYLKKFNAICLRKGDLKGGILHSIKYFFDGLYAYKRKIRFLLTF